MSEMEPIIKVYVKTGLKFKTGDFFTVEKIRDEADSYVLELVKTEPEEHVDSDYLYEWARDNYEPDPEDFHHDLD